MEVFEWDDKADGNEDQEGADELESAGVTVAENVETIVVFIK